VKLLYKGANIQMEVQTAAVLYICWDTETFPLAGKAIGTVIHNLHSWQIFPV